MRVATFNLLHGRSLSDGLVDLDRLRAAVREIGADVLGLQEVDRDQPRSGGADLTEVTAQAMDAAHWRFVPALVGEPGGHWRPATDADVARAAAGAPPPEPAYGVGLVSRLPVLAWHTVRLPSAPVRSPILVPGTRRPILLRDEPRVGVAAVVETPVGPVTVATTHLSFVPGWNGVQLRRLVAGLRHLPAPQVLVGDLNLPGPLPRWLSGWRTLVESKTYPAPKPSVQLDHVLGSPDAPHVLGAWCGELALSDHRALSVDLDTAGTGTPSPR